MTDVLPLTVAAIALGLGTFAFRISGPALRRLYDGSTRTDQIINDATVILLVAVLATTALTEEQSFAGPSRAVGVLVAGILVWRRAPFLVVVLSAAAATAILRLLTVP
jgi:uncharacterized membrane protein